MMHHIYREKCNYQILNHVIKIINVMDTDIVIVIKINIVKKNVELNEIEYVYLEIFNLKELFDDDFYYGDDEIYDSKNENLSKIIKKKIKT